MSEDERPELTAVLDHFEVQYKPGRVSQMVRCPLHEDRTPSCSINTNKGLFKCHSCGKGGDSYALIMAKKEVDFVEAKRFAEQLGLEMAAGSGEAVEQVGSQYGGRRRKPAGRKPGAKSYTPSFRRGQ